MTMEQEQLEPMEIEAVPSEATNSEPTATEEVETPELDPTVPESNSESALRRSTRRHVPNS